MKFIRPRRLGIIGLAIVSLVLLLITASAVDLAHSQRQAHAATLAGTITPISDPAVFITSPTANTIFGITQGPLLIPITALAYGGNNLPVVQVSFTVNGKEIGVATTSPYTVTWGVSTLGSYVLQAIATLSNGSHIPSQTVPVTVVHLDPPPPTPTPTSTPTATPTAVTGSSCSVHYAITSQWPGGFGASITIKNTGTTSLSSWSLAFSFPNGQTITQLWNGAYTQVGSAVTISNLSYNATLAPGATVTPGFNGSWNTLNNSPTAFTLNNQACTVN